MKKRLIAILMIAALALGILAGCKDEETIVTTPSEGTVYTVVLAHDFEGAAAEVLSTYAAKLSESFSFIEVVIMPAADITEENQPNVLIALPEQIAELAADGVLQDMDTFKAENAYMMHNDGSMVPMNISEEQQEDMYDAFYNEGVINGKLYAMPLAKGAQLMYYNKTFLDENMIDLPRNWEELEIALEQIKSIDPSCIPLCIDDEAGFLVSLFAQYQGGYTTEKGEYKFNSETNRDLMKKLNTWFQKGYITTKTLMNRQGVSSTNAKEPCHYIVFGSSADADANKPVPSNDSFSFEMGIFPFLQQSYETRKVLARGPSIALYKCDDVDVLNCAWMLIKTLSTDVEFQARFAEASGLQPVLQSVYIEEQYSSFMDQADGATNVSALAALTCMDQETAQFTAFAFDGAANAYTQMGELLNKCLPLTGSDVAAQIEAAFTEAENACK